MLHQHTRPFITPSLHLCSFNLMYNRLKSKFELGTLLFITATRPCISLHHVYYYMNSIHKSTHHAVAPYGFLCIAYSITKHNFFTKM